MANHDPAFLSQPADLPCNCVLPRTESQTLIADAFITTLCLLELNFFAFYNAEVLNVFFMCSYFEFLSDDDSIMHVLTLLLPGYLV